MNEKIPFYVLNDFLRFERKIYQVFGKNLGRPIEIKTALYFIGFVIMVFVLSAIPILGDLLKQIPLVMRLALAGFAAFLLTDVGTENRSPLRFFQSLLKYHILKMKQESYYKGKVITKQPSLGFEKPPETKIAQKPKAKREDSYRFGKGVTIIKERI